jgi:RimJ/RimL family protein N-acetyltransferase
MAIRLTRFDKSHLPAFAELLTDPDVERFTRLPVPTPPDFPRTWLARYEAGRRDGSSEAFAVVDGPGGFLGVALAFGIEPEARTAELGYIVAPAARGRGVGTAALRLLTEWGFSERGLLRLELVISVDNEASKVVAARSGYIREGVLRSLHVKEDVREDHEMWSCLPSDLWARDRSRQDLHRVEPDLDAGADREQ